ncbi:hypothetical protein [Amycolatopsis kentuckyensis]|uniref:hypothetical protein n=1 Tax=Amycolatopsis kentuckyensis TaxID=218823 RepID=UPI0035636755
MNFPEIARFDQDFATGLAISGDFDFFQLDGIHCSITTVDGWTVGFELGGRRVIVVHPEMAAPLHLLAEGEAHVARELAFLAIAALRFSADPVATAVEWMRALIRRHGHTTGLGMAHQALGTDLYRVAFDQWEESDGPELSAGARRRHV